MNKKILLILILIVLIIAVLIVFLMAFPNKKIIGKIIYSRDDYISGDVGEDYLLNIYTDRTIEWKYTRYGDSSGSNKNIRKKMTVTEYKELITLMEKVENSKLSEIEHNGSLSALIGHAKEYMNLNKYILITENDVTYSNKEIIELNNYINDLENKYIKEE